MYAFVLNQFYAKPRWNHRQRTEAPSFPVVSVVVRFFQRTQVSECPCNLIAVSLHIAVFRLFGSYYHGDVSRYTWFFGNANNHIILFYCKGSELIYNIFLYSIFYSLKKFVSTLKSYIFLTPKK